MKNIAIIGSGVSGLAAAVHLLENAPNGSVAITIYEARHIAGGRTRSYLDPETGDTLDNGQHLLMGCYTATEAYMRSIGTTDLVRRSHNLKIPFAIFNEYSGNARTATLKTSPFPAPFHALLGLFRTDLLTFEEKLAAIRMGRHVDRYLSDPETMNWTCSDLFAKARQSSGLIHKLWEPLCLATVNAPIKTASCRAFLMVLKIALLESRSNSTLLFPEVGLSELLIDPATVKLEALGVRFRFRCPVVEVSVREGGFLLHTSSTESEQRFDSVILCTCRGEMKLPPSVSIPSFEFSPIVNGYFWLDREILHSPIQAFINTTLQWAFVKPTKYAAQRLALTVSSATDLVEYPSDQIIDILWRDLRHTIPEANEARLVHSQIIKEKRATPLFTAHSYQMRPEISTKCAGFYLAGDIVQNGLPATIEGAILNGVQAAQKIIEY